MTSLLCLSIQWGRISNPFLVGDQLQSDIDNLIAGWCKRWPVVIGKAQGIDDIPAHRKPCQPRDRERLYHLIAETTGTIGSLVERWHQSARLSI